MRNRAPPYNGEGPHALWHVSEDDAIRRFEPHRAGSASSDELLVWAVDTRHLPMFWFPRDCPRGTFWAGSRTSGTDVEGFLDGDARKRVHAVEAAWLGRIRETKAFAYRLPEETFAPQGELGGYWISRQSVEPLEVVALGDLFALHAAAGIEVRMVANLWPLWDRVIASTLEFSGIRLRNAAR